MSVLDAAPELHFEPDTSTLDDEETIDLRAAVIDIERRRPEAPTESRQVTPTPPRTVLPAGLRVQRVRVGSIAKIAAVFFTVGNLAVLGTLVVCWNVLQRLGFVSDVEELAVTSLGLEQLTIDGQQLFEVAAIVSSVVFGLGFVIAVLLAMVYNASCALFGGVALEFGPLRRPKRVFSLRHRRFVSIV